MADGLAASALAAAPFLRPGELRNLLTALGPQSAAQLGLAVTQTVPARLPVDPWSQVVQAVGCRSLHASLGAIAAACTTVSGPAGAPLSAPGDATPAAAAVSPMQDPVVTALAQ
jgi:hypothetical protein